MVLVTEVSTTRVKVIIRVTCLRLETLSFSKIRLLSRKYDVNEDGNIFLFFVFSVTSNGTKFGNLCLVIFTARNICVFSWTEMLDRAIIIIAQFSKLIFARSCISSSALRSQTQQHKFDYYTSSTLHMRIAVGLDQFNILGKSL